MRLPEEDRSLSRHTGWTRAHWVAVADPWYAEGLAAGVDPASPERWPSLDETPQARVEAASIALALHETRALIWEALDDRVRQQVVEWRAAAIGLRYPASNWVWFQNISEAFLRSAGGPWSKEDIERNIELSETWYRGDGWYTDSLAGGHTPGKYDWYAGWAMNFLPTVLVHGGRRPRVGARLRLTRALLRLTPVPPAISHRID